MQITIEIAKYNDMDEMTPFQKLKFSSIDEAIANVEFLKLGYDYFKNGEILAVRADNSSRIHLIDHDSTVPLNELRKDLENKYTFSTQKDLDYDEIEFKITTKPEKKSLNSNFKFEKNENTKYAKTSTGENLPFKLFRTDDTGVRSNLLRESQNSGNSTDFALIERRFSENNSLQFFGTEKIQNHNDIAWLFKSLEDEAVEHAFLVYDFVDKGYFVQHISTGSYNAAIIDNKSIIGNIIEANPASVTLVHNHPSGNLVASPADAHILEKLKNALKSTDVKVNDGIIINLRSGNYLVFNEQNLSDLKHREESFKTSIKVQSYSFSKQILVENFQPIQVKSPEEVAAYITSQKFGISDKTEMLILNSQLSIVGKFILPVNNQENSIIENVSKFGGSSCVLYGNNITPELIDFYSKRLEHSNITITDAILLKSENGQKMWESFIEEGKIEKNYKAKTDYFSENNKSNNTVMEDDPNSLGYYQNKGVVGGKIKDIAAEAIRNPESIKQYDSQTQNVINLYINQNPNIMESPQKEFDLALHLKTQLKYLGFGEGEKLHKDLEKGLNSQEKQFSIITSSDKALPGNKIDYAINFNKSENGGVFLNSYDATLNNSKGETVSQNFKIGKDNSFTAKEALNLLEGRSVKIEFTNPKTDQKETSFVQLNLAEKKNEYGNYNFQSFHQNYGVDTEKIVEKSNIIFDKPEYKDNTIKNLEKGNIVNVKFEMKDNVIEGKAVLNPQYKNLSLYDNEMNRVNTNEPIKGLENDQKHEKSNVREQSISRGI